MLVLYSPLVAQGRDCSPALHGSADTIATEGCWVLQMLATIPIPVIIIFQVQLLLIHSLGNTLVDGNNPIVCTSLYHHLLSRIMKLTSLCSLRWCRFLLPIDFQHHYPFCSFNPSRSYYNSPHHIRHFSFLLLDRIPLYPRRPAQSLVPANRRIGSPSLCLGQSPQSHPRLCPPRCDTPLWRSGVYR